MSVYATNNAHTRSNVLTHVVTHGNYKNKHYVLQQIAADVRNLMRIPLPCYSRSMSMKKSFNVRGGSSLHMLISSVILCILISFTLIICKIKVLSSS